MTFGNHLYEKESILPTSNLRPSVDIYKCSGLNHVVQVQAHVLEEEDEGGQNDDQDHQQLGHQSAHC